jgi:Tol biopolymer transport system component
MSGDGTLIYAPGGRVGTDRQLVIVDAAGNVTPFSSERRAYENPPAASRDGRRVAVVVPNPKGTYETWVADLDRPGLKRALALPDADCATPVWSPDGQRLAYNRTARDKDDGVYVQRADGAGAPQAVIKGDSKEINFSATSWVPDGSGLLVNKSLGGKRDMLLVPVTAGGEGKGQILRATPYDEGGARFSPDGQLVAFVSDESGKGEVYVAAYANGALGPAIMVSNGGGARPAWAGDGRRLFYCNDANKLMSVTVTAKPVLSASAPVVAQNLKKLRVNQFEWDILPDGRLLAIQRGEGEDDITQFDVVLNWLSDLPKTGAAGH